MEQYNKEIEKEKEVLFEDNDLVDFKSEDPSSLDNHYLSLCIESDATNIDSKSKELSKLLSNESKIPWSDLVALLLLTIVVTFLTLVKSDKNDCIHSISETRDTSLDKKLRSNDKNLIQSNFLSFLPKPGVLIKEHIYCISEKLLLIVNSKKLLFLPYLNNEKIEREYLINNKVLLIKKINKEFYGYFIIKNVIHTDNTEYSKLIIEYNLCEIENLYFLEYKKINIFEYKILFKDILNNNEIKLPRMNNYNLYEFNCSKIIKIINNIKEEIIKEEITKEEVDKNIIENCKEEITKEEVDKNIIENCNDEVNDNIIYFNIPILWIPCSKLKRYIKNQKISKPTIKNHYKTCINCEINNNNRFDIDFENKRYTNKCSHFKDKNKRSLFLTEQQF
jgi:hypothetical protein